MAPGRLPADVSHKLIHHSDRGCQYASAEYVNTLKHNGIKISMTENGDPKENAKAERINGTIKNELLKGTHFTSEEESRYAIENAVDFYNNKRPHMSINMLTPREASDMKGRIPKKWTSYREKAIIGQKALGRN